MNPLDLQRLAVRIETLQRVPTHDWNPGDDLDLQRSLPGGRGRLVLPQPSELRKLALGPVEDHPSVADLRTWQQLLLRLESLVHDNRPGNMKRVIRDMARGRIPRFR